ncbi:MAG: Rieske 2Fe-2S domain-containing protein [Chloroflexi bacterium]|nr:Rieske 2Fe-2S domain-containing protein [Chloroflexota bacterium]
MIEAQSRPLVSADGGIVSRRIFTDEAIYELERDRIFRQCWTFLGHDSMIPKAGDFISNYIGEDPVILWRGSSGQPRVFLNTCIHRGNKLCLFDSGHAPALTCSYHGWTFNNEGQLTGVPFEKAAYPEGIERGSRGLVTAKVATYGGLIFASWDPSVPSLDDYLGEMRWWLDKFLCFDDFGGMTYLPSAQKYRMPGNWKLTADNFIGDFYHVPIAHASFMRLFGAGDNRYEPNPMGSFSFLCEPAHGIGAVGTHDGQFQQDMHIAQYMGPDAQEWVKARDAKRKERLADAAKADGFIAGATFPNMTFQGVGAFEGELIAVAHPRGPLAHEVWQWLLFERDAPASVRRYAAAWTARRQSANGLVGEEDGENFERIAETARAPMTPELTFDYTMRGYTADRETWNVHGLPGEPSRAHFSETNQRGFYRYWAKQMGLEGQAAA